MVNHSYKISVIVCTYNPKIHILNKVLDALKNQTLNYKYWELIIVDNKSDEELSKLLNLDWHKNTKIIREKKSGLFFARLRGVKRALSPLIVFVDDDNILKETYLSDALHFYENHPQVGCFGGKSVANFEVSPPDWFFDCGINLGCQQYGEDLYISNYESKDFKVEFYPEKAPIGTGMVIKRDLFLRYMDSAQNSQRRSSLGRKGKSLTSGEDNDIILTIISFRYEIAYIPKLVVNHFITKNRLDVKYLSDMSFASNRSWVKVLHLHDILPWKPIYKSTLPFRYLNSYIKNKAWKGKINYIRWRGACGLLKGLSEL